MGHGLVGASPHDRDGRAGEEGGRSEARRRGSGRRRRAAGRRPQGDDRHRRRAPRVPGASSDTRAQLRNVVLARIRGQVSDVDAEDLVQEASVGPRRQPARIGVGARRPHAVQKTTVRFLAPAGWRSLRCTTTMVDTTTQPPSASPRVVVPVRLTPGLSTGSGALAPVRGLYVQSLTPEQGVAAQERLRLSFRPNCIISVDADEYEDGARDRLTPTGHYKSMMLPSPCGKKIRRKYTLGRLPAAFPIAKWIPTSSGSYEDVCVRLRPHLSFSWLSRSGDGR